MDILIKRYLHYLQYYNLNSCIHYQITFYIYFKFKLYLFYIDYKTKTCVTCINRWHNKIHENVQWNNNGFTISNISVNLFTFGLTFLFLLFSDLSDKKQQIHALNLLVLLLPNVHRHTLCVCIYYLVHYYITCNFGNGFCPPCKNEEGGEGELSPWT